MGTTRGMVARAFPCDSAPAMTLTLDSAGNDVWL
jgi:hypothetical protein